MVLHRRHFTGARVEELAEAPSELVFVGDIACVDLREAGTKTGNSPRLVPVLPELQRLGFVVWAKGKAMKGKQKLFEGGEASDDWSKWTNRYLDQIGLDDPTTITYSLRHSFINPENPPNGPYGGASLVWFPRHEGCLIVFVIGTRGLSPDEGILTRPGHRRRIASLRRHLVNLGVEVVWARQDPATVGAPVPDLITRQLSPWEPVFKRYGNELYCLAKVPKDDGDKARQVVQAFLDLYAYERGWEVLKEAKDEFTTFIHRLNAAWLSTPSDVEIARLLNERRFVVLEGPPGTGKTRVAEMILKETYKGNGFVTQFHPSTTYEDFVAGLSPDVAKDDLRFCARAGHLLRAAALAKDDPALLIVDEINRADLGRVLGEAIYLFEAENDGNQREVDLPHVIDGKQTFALPKRLCVLATMNTADRSVARMDLAIRRRFAFVTMMPDRKVVQNHSTEIGLRLFDALCDVFLEFAPDDALALLPGHSYFIVPNRDEAVLQVRLRHELLPLIDDYIREGYLGPATAALHAVRNQIADAAEAF